MPLHGEYEPSPAQWVRDQVEEYESSGGTRGTTMRERPVIILTTRGSRSGKIRKAPLMRVEHDGKYLIVASLGGAPQHPVWYRNVSATPTVEIQDGASKQDMAARELAGEEREIWWKRAVDAYPPYAEFQETTARVIPILLCEPV